MKGHLQCCLWPVWRSMSSSRKKVQGNQCQQQGLGRDKNKIDTFGVNGGRSCSWYNREENCRDVCPGKPLARVTVGNDILQERRKLWNGKWWLLLCVVLIESLIRMKLYQICWLIGLLSKSGGYVPVGTSTDGRRKLFPSSHRPCALATWGSLLGLLPQGLHATQNSGGRFPSLLKQILRIHAYKYDGGHFLQANGLIWVLARESTKVEIW